MGVLLKEKQAGELLGTLDSLLPRLERPGQLSSNNWLNFFRIYSIVRRVLSNLSFLI